MGQWYHTNFAVFNNEVISVSDALSLVEKGIDLRGKLTHAVLTDIPVKFVPSTKQDNYFAVINKDSIPKELRPSCSEHFLHKEAKNIIVKEQSITLDGVVLPSYTAKEEVRVYNVSDNDADYIIPDVTITSPDMTYYIEIKNTHSVDTRKLARYKYLYKHTSEPFKVIEIDISDLIDASKTDSFGKLLVNLTRRVICDSPKKIVLDLSDKKKIRFNAFGKCWHCGKSVELCNNIKCPDKMAISGIPTCKIAEIDLEKTGDATHMGSAMTYCPTCVEGRFNQIMCPKCLSKGVVSPMKVLRNTKTGKIYLACCKNETYRERYLLEQKGEDSFEYCDFTLTVYEKDTNTYADEIKAVGGLSKLYSNYNSSMKKLINLRSKMKEIRNNEEV